MRLRPRTSPQPLSVTERGWGEVLGGTASPSGTTEKPWSTKRLRADGVHRVRLTPAAVATTASAKPAVAVNDVTAPVRSQRGR